MTEIKYQLYDADNNCTHLKHQTDIVPMVGDIMTFDVEYQEAQIYCEVTKRQYASVDNALIIILKKLF
jgi:hypothetical protein